jgi:hypothetical protein
MLVLVGALSPVLGQVTVEVTQEQAQFLSGEAIATAVRISNRTGQTLHLGEDVDWITFTIESREGGVVARLGDVPVQGEFTLPNAKMATKRVDLQPYFAVALPGHYTVVALVRIKGWDRDISSTPRSFDIIEGAKLWEQTFGLPKPAAATNVVPEARRYILQRVSYLKSQLRLYLRVTDGEGGKVFRVLPVGPLVSFSHPEPRVDKDSLLHLLYQTGANTFNYTVFNPDGELLIRQNYEYANGRPRLRDDDGIITIQGGVRHESAKDFPPPQDEDASPETPAKPAPPPDNVPVAKPK